MENPIVDWNALILSKFEHLNDELRGMRGGVIQLTAEIQNIVKALSRIEIMIDKLKERDNDQEKRLNELRLDQHRLDSAVSTLCTTTDNCERNLAELHNRVGVMRVKLDKASVQCEGCADFRNKWRPWLSALKWVVIIVAGVLVTAVAVWLLRDVAQSVVGGV